MVPKYETATGVCGSKMKHFAVRTPYACYARPIMKHFAVCRKIWSGTLCREAHLRCMKHSLAAVFLQNKKTVAFATAFDFVNGGGRWIRQRSEAQLCVSIADRRSRSARQPPFENSLPSAGCRWKQRSVLKWKKRCQNLCFETAFILFQRSEFNTAYVKMVVGDGPTEHILITAWSSASCNY